MKVIPAIDIKNGKCVRLEEGDMNKETIYSKDVLEISKKWIDQGAEILHIVDLDGAVTGKSINSDLILKITKTFGNKVIQVGGGIRELTTASKYLDNGVDRIIIGTQAVENVSFIRQLCDSYPNRIILGVDAKEGLIRTKGWKEKTEIKALDLVRRYNNFPLSAIIYTDISRDGMMSGVNLEFTFEIARNTNVPVIASGGISNLEQLIQLTSSGLIYGAIVGRAIYEGAFDLQEAIKVENLL